MSTFALWQPRYAEHGIATFPVVDKRPAISNYLKLGRAGSEQLTLKFPNADALGFALKRNHICILDVDTTDERVLADALSDHGPTPFIVLTGGGFHAYYLHSGEPRRVRPWPDKPIDLLGDGFAVAPPSRGSKGSYAIIQGTLEDLHHLPSMQGIAPPANENQAGTGLIRQGARNEALRNRCMREAPACDTFNDLLDVAMTFSNDMLDRIHGHPFTDADVFKAAKWAWDKTVAGDNWFGRGGMVALDFAVIDEMAGPAPYACALLIFLKRAHSGRKQFVLANATADLLGWSLVQFKKARDHLVKIGRLRCIHPGGKGRNDPPIYGW
jgi:hypothetical protein